MTEPSENPYQSPSIAAADDQDRPLMEVQRGRRIFAGLSLGIATFEAWLLYNELSTERMVAAILTLGLFYAMWIGQQWAVSIVALNFVLAAVAAMVFGVGSGTLLGFAIALLCSLIFAGVFWLFVTSESLNAFFRHQHAEHNASDEEENQSPE